MAEELDEVPAVEIELSCGGQIVTDFGAMALYISSFDTAWLIAASVCTGQVV